MKKSKLVKIAGVAIALVCCIGFYLGKHFVQTVSISHPKNVLKAAGKQFSENMNVESKYKHEKTIYKDSYAASLLYDEIEQKYSVLVFRKDSVWKNRYKIVNSWAADGYGRISTCKVFSKKKGNATVIGGYSLPKDAKYYTITNAGEQESSDIIGGTVLDIYITEKANDITSVPVMYNDKDELIF